MSKVIEDKAQEKTWKEQDEEYQGIAKPVYDILGNHMGFGGKAVDGKLILNAEHHALSFEIQSRLRELGYRKLLDGKLREKIILLLSSGMLRRSDALNGKGELLEDDTYLFLTKKYKGVLADRIQALILPKDKPSFSLGSGGDS